MNQGVDKGKIKSFTDLIVWQEAHKLVLKIYEVTKSFPKEEIFGLVMQLRRAGVSITSNIAEGFSRQSYKDKVHFYSMALGSLTEVQNQILVSKDIKYLVIEEFKYLADQTVVVSKLLNGLIKSSKTLIHNS
ncbi:MAG: four helix bundle protein [Candidatus Doudnabacteria bacterium]|jgi:four helix bundle protein